MRTQLEKSICCAGGLCKAVAVKFLGSGQCGKIFPRCYAAYKAVTTRIKLMLISYLRQRCVENFRHNHQITLEFLMKLCIFFQSGMRSN